VILRRCGELERRQKGVRAPPLDGENRYLVGLHLDVIEEEVHLVALFKVFEEHAIQDDPNTVTGQEVQVEDAFDPAPIIASTVAIALAGLQAPGVVGEHAIGPPPDVVPHQSKDGAVRKVRADDGVGGQGAGKGTRIRQRDRDTVALTNGSACRCVKFQQ
jgi:hypothetical protein